MKINKNFMLLVAFAASSMYAQQTPQQDTLLQLMHQELDYSFSQLKEQEQAPYFMSLRTIESYETVITTSYGVLNSCNVMHEKRLAPQIRLGSMELDNFKYTTQGVATKDQQVSQGIRLPLGNQWDKALRQLIWQEVLNRYEFACGVMSETQSRAKTNNDNEDKAPCFSAAPAEHYYEQPLAASQCHIDCKAWEDSLKAVSAIFRTCPDLRQGDATLTFSAQRTWMINTDGSEVVQNRIVARILLQAAAKADDGMDLPLYEDFFAYDIKDFPSVALMKQKAEQMIKRLLALKSAPVADPYTGPAMMSGAASGVFFHEIFGHRLEGHRLKTGGQTFKKMIGKHVLPDAFQVYCDPTLTQYHGQDLNGHYLYDDEGVKARRVDNVVNGVLKSFLMSRVPLDGFPESNGHGRTSNGGDPVSRQSNLIVETTQPYTEAQLRDMLRKEAAKQYQEYGYYFKTVTSGFTFTGEGGSLNSFNVTPLEVYRVYVDGRPDELVRGVDMIGTPLSMFSNIEAAGDTPATFTGMCGAESGWVPVTASAPIIYVSKIETQRREQEHDLPSILSCPMPASTELQLQKKAMDDVIFTALEDEMRRTRDSLCLEGQPLPFYVTYNFGRFHQTQASATLGAVTNMNIRPWGSFGSMNLAVGDYRVTSDAQPGQLGALSDLCNEVEYGTLRRSYWQMSDQFYKQVLSVAAQKAEYLRKQPLPAGYASIHQMQQLPPADNIVNRQKEVFVDSEWLTNYLSEISKVFLDYPELYDTRVNVNGFEIDNYKISSEDVRIKIPSGYGELVTHAKVRASDSSVIDNQMELLFTDLDQLPSIENAKKQVREFADRMKEMSAAPASDEYYNGPVLYIGESLGLGLFQNLISPVLIAQPNYFEASNQMALRLGSEIVDRNISITNITDMQTDADGSPFFGFGEQDAEGVDCPPHITLIDKGVFHRQLNGRFPAFKAPISTGSSRFYDNPAQGLAIQTAPAVLNIEAQKTMTMDKMEKQLLKEAKSAKKDYAYIVEVKTGELEPVVTRIDVKTGQRMQVRASVPAPTIQNLQSVPAISSERARMDIMLGAAACSMLYPKAMVVTGVEIKPLTVKPEKKPAIPSPLLR